MKKKNWPLWRQTVFSRDTCWWLTRHHYLSKPGGGGGGGLGGVAYKDRAGPPPRAAELVHGLPEHLAGPDGGDRLLPLAGRQAQEEAAVDQMHLNTNKRQGGRGRGREEGMKAHGRA